MADYEFLGHQIMSGEISPDEITSELLPEGLGFLVDDLRQMAHDLVKGTIKGAQPRNFEKWVQQLIFEVRCDSASAAHYDDRDWD